MDRPNPKRFSCDLESASKDAPTLFQDALSKMDKVIGFGSSDVSTFGHQTPAASKIVVLCEELKGALLSVHKNGTTDPRLDIPPDTRDTLVTWLLGDPRGSPVTNQLHQDRDSLLQQINTLERKLRVCQMENDSLKQSMMDKMMPPNILSENQPIRTNSTGALHFRDDSVTSSYSLQHHYNRGSSASALASNNNGGNLKRNRSFRDSFRKAFNRKKGGAKENGLENDNSVKTLNPRAQYFHSLNGPDLAEWMTSVGLEMYGELISQLVGTGERLASICSNTEDMMRLGVLNVLHCKKLKLAVENAVTDVPSPLSKLDHRWVGDWLRDVGLPQYQPAFMDARIDAQMLNSLSLEDLEFLKIDHPFHITSLRRAIQAFRMCDYDPNYLKTGQEKGGYKLFHWSVYHLMDWLRDIELDEFAGALQGTGINGPVVAMESTLTHESIAKAIGIGRGKSLIITHLGERFVNIIGPIFAQKKVEMMHHKHFVPLDVTVEPNTKGRVRSKSTSKKSKHSQQKEETYLCPLNEVLPVIPKLSRSSATYSVKGSVRIGTTTSNKSAAEICNYSTVSSGNRRSFYTPSPQEQPLANNSPSLLQQNNQSTITAPPTAGAPAPPPPPPPPPLTNGF